VNRPRSSWLGARASVVALAAAVATALAGGGPAAAQTSQDSGLHVKVVSSPAPGSVQVLIAADPPHDAAIGAQPNAGDFTVWLDDGAAPGLTAARNGARGKPLTSVLVVDESGSYKTGHGNKVARPTIGTYLGGAGGDELALILFAGDVKATGPTNAAGVTAELNTLPKRRPKVATSVTNGVEAGVELAIKEGEAGLREVVVFTDGGHEALLSADAWPKLIERAASNGVRVSVIVPVADRAPAQTSHTNWVTTIEGLQKLARDTGGVYLATEEPAAAAARLGAARGELKNWLTLEGKLCGLERGKPVEVRVEYVPGHQRKAWSASATLPSSAYAPGSDVACPSLCATACPAWEDCIGGACAARACSGDLPCPPGASCVGGTCQQACSAPCEPWQECKGGACVAKSCTADEVCGPGSRCANGVCAKPAGAGTDLLVWILAGAGATLLLIALAVLLRKKKPPPVAHVEPAPPEPPPVVEEPVAPPVVAAPDLDPLPETHLVAMGGWATPGERWRLHQRRTIAGASADPADKVDLRFAIKQVSGRHAAFELYPSGDLWVSDLGSSNGTFVNGKRLAAKERAKLVVGDQVKLSQQLVLVIERPGVTGEPRPAEAAQAPAAEAAQGEPAGSAKSKKATRFDPGDR
jgi:hypothetical protein